MAEEGTVLVGRVPVVEIGLVFVMEWGTVTEEAEAVEVVQVVEGMVIVVATMVIVVGGMVDTIVTTATMETRIRA